MKSEFFLFVNQNHKAKRESDHIRAHSTPRRDVVVIVDFTERERNQGVKRDNV